MGGGRDTQRAASTIDGVTGSARFRDLTIGEFVERLSSSAPTPGGGSAAGVAGSLAAALVAMVAGLSEGRERYAEHAPLHARAKTAATDLSARLLSLADEDAAAFDAYGTAMRMPRDDDEQRAARTASIRRAAAVAAEVPLRTVEAVREVAALAEALAGRSNVNASSDLSVASLLAETAARGAGENVLVNLPSLNDEDRSSHLRERTEALLGDVERLAARTREVVSSGEARPPLPAPAP